MPEAARHLLLVEDEAALRELKVAAQIEPDNPRPHYSLAQIYRKSQQKDLAALETETFERLQTRATAEKPQLVPAD